WSEQGEDLDPTFRIINTVRVTVRDAARVGELLSIALQNGANQVNNVQYTISNPGELRSQARELAVANAREIATQLAELSGVTLGPVVYIDESTTATADMGGGNARMYAEASM